MGKVDSFQIILEKPSGIFTSGEMVQGKLVVSIRERLKINKLELILEGNGMVIWTEPSASFSNCAREEYAHRNWVFLAKDPNNDCYLEVGEQSFQFQFQLPQNLPPNFEHDNARVEYFLRGDIDIPWAFDKTVYLSFTVTSHFDLNTNPKLREPKMRENTELIGYYCCKADSFILKLSISKTGFVSGEMLSFKAILDNKCSISMRYVSFKVIQLIECNVRGKSRTFSRSVIELACPKKIKARMSEEWNDSVIIPPICPSSNGSRSTIMKIRYGAELFVDPSESEFDIYVIIPIVIGTVPISGGAPIKATKANALPIIKKNK